MLGHELTHIRNGDVRMLVIAVIIAGVDRVLRRTVVPHVVPGRLPLRRLALAPASSDRGKGGAGIAIVIAIALIAVAWLLSVVIRFALSR